MASFILKHHIRIIPIFFELVLKSLYIGHGFISLQTRRKVQVVVRKSRLAKYIGKRDLRLYFVKRFSRLFYFLHLYSRYYAHRLLGFARTRRAGMCLSISKHKNPLFTTFKLRNKLAGEHVDYMLFFFSQTTLLLLRLEVPILLKNSKSKPYFFWPNLSKHPSFSGLQ